MLNEEGLYLGARETRFLPFPGSGVKKKPKWIIAAEIVETRRVYARTIAKVEPEWIEHAGRHLLKVSYSDPHWAKKPAHVAASMRATLYGLPVVNGRKVHYGPLDPKLAREIFIRAALVAGEYDSRAPFLSHNRKLLAEIDDLSHRARDARLAVDDEALYRFFDDRIPEGIHNGADFEKWRRETEARSPRLLFLERAALLEKRGANPGDFPLELDLGGVRFALAYHFDPGAEDDGVTLLIPLAALNQVPEAPCQWLVPGLLEEKVIALIKTLPQSVRRAFVPVPEFARAAVEALGNEARGTRKVKGASPPHSASSIPAITDALADFLTRATGQVIPRDAWRPEALAAHLRMNFRVLDEANRVLAEGRDLAALRQQLGAQASASLSQAAAAQAAARTGKAGKPRQDSAPAAVQERDEVARWDFGDLPEQVQLQSGGRQVAAFPALTDEGGRVRLRLLDSPALARERHRRGVCRLLWLAFPDLFKQTQRDLAQRLKPAAMHYLLLDKGLNLEALLGDVLFAAAYATLAALETDPADLRLQTRFESAAQGARPRLADTARETARLAAECLAHGQGLNQQLARTSAPREAVADLRAQLQALVYPGFLASTPPAHLPHLPRYLKGMEVRLERLDKNPARDRQLMTGMAGLLANWRARGQREVQGGGLSPAMADFRWRLEELRISLFAQQLKTPEPVSVKRLEKLWAELTG